MMKKIFWTTQKRKISYKLILLTLLTSCIQPLPPCQGSEEQVYRCESMRIQKEQLRRLKYMQSQQNANNFKRQWDKDTKGY